MSDSNSYDLRSEKMPYLSGLPLRLFVSLLEGPLGQLLISNLFSSVGVNKFRKLSISDTPTFKPIHYSDSPATEGSTIPFDRLPRDNPPAAGFHFTTINDYAEAYSRGKITPLKVAQRILEAIEDSNSSNPPLRAIIACNAQDVLDQAKASQQRHDQNCPLSILDGVPVAVKDELDMLPYPTTGGTAFLGDTPAVRDSTVVSRLRQAGALLIGKANMHEIGINVTGLNPHHGCTRNPYNRQHYTGGSSSGSAAAVAAGLCPVAIGADGGGSIRIPASFCGLVGLKSTFGRISEYGALDLDWSVAHIGPIAASTTDTAIVWGIIAGPDPLDPDTLFQPAPDLMEWDKIDLSGLIIGVFRPWFNHSSDDMHTGCQKMLAHLTGLGATLIEVDIPDLDACRVAHLITISSEMAQAMDATHTQHGKEHSLDVRTNLRLARAFSAQDYIKAQRIRTRMMAHFDRALQTADVIVTPATGLPAPPIKPGALPSGDSDLSLLLEIMRYSQPANLTGLPAIAFPAGYNSVGLPIGMQAIGRPWQEATLLRIALSAEQAVERLKPVWHYDILNE